MKSRMAIWLVSTIICAAMIILGCNGSGHIKSSPEVQKSPDTVNTPDTAVKPTSTSEPKATESPIEARAAEILEGMSLEEKVGQMFIVRCPQENAMKKLEEFHLGGYDLFANDFEGKTA